jgi:hypothetical protein
MQNQIIYGKIPKNEEIGGRSESAQRRSTSDFALRFFDLTRHLSLNFEGIPAVYSADELESGNLLAWRLYGGANPAFI